MDWGREPAFLFASLFAIPMGLRVLEDQRLRALSDLAAAERSRVGQGRWKKAGIPIKPLTTDSVVVPAPGVAEGL